MSSSAKGAATLGAEAAEMAAKQEAKKKANVGMSQSGKAGMFLGSVAGFTLITPHFWMNMFSLSQQVGNDERYDHGGASKAPEVNRAARRNSLKEFKETYYGQKDEHEYPPGAYWDRFNNNTLVSQKHNPNAKKVDAGSFKKKKSVGMYDSEGNVDATRSRENNEWRRKRSQSYMKEAGAEAGSSEAGRAVAAA
jgi:hypothetical protein